ncbi:hypothetical protein [Luteolibacter sp. Populi]|uniref:hypothetical protein n=1 Tax=Luteolibacter sp. Populi TaxID=3230487 RepID=UPI003467CA7B
MSVPAAAAAAKPPPMDSEVMGRFDDFSDKLSPMLVKELRQGLRAKTFVIVFLTLQALLAVVLLIGISAASPEGAGQVVSKVIFLFFSMAVLLVQPLRGVGALHNEIKGNTIDLMVLTRLGAWRIVLGKWVAIVSQSALLLTAIAPYLILRYFFGGMNLFAELLLLGLVFLGSAIFTAFTVGISAIAPILVRGLVPLVVAIGIAMGIFGAIFDDGFHEMIEFCSLQKEGMGWGLLAGILTGVYGGWFALASGTSMIAPMAENHSTARRVAAIAAVLALAVIAWGGDFDRASVCVLLVLFSVPAIAFALTEPFELLPPVCRPFLKYGAAGKLAGRFFYPGWPSGILFTALLLGLGAAVHFGLQALNPGYMPGIDRARMQDVTMLAFTGTLLLPAVVLRIFSAKVRHAFAFYLFIAVILGGLTLGLAMISQWFITEYVESPKFLWYFSWIPPVKMLLAKMIQDDFYAVLRDGRPTTGAPNYVPVVITGLITTGTYLAVLLVFAVRKFAALREIEEDADAQPVPDTAP